MDLFFSYNIKLPIFEIDKSLDAEPNGQIMGNKSMSIVTTDCANMIMMYFKRLKFQLRNPRQINKINF